jgi:hypothetical protein
MIFLDIPEKLQDTWLIINKSNLHILLIHDKKWKQKFVPVFSTREKAFDHYGTRDGIILRKLAQTSDVEELMYAFSENGLLRFVLDMPNPQNSKPVHDLPLYEVEITNLPEAN